MITDNTSTSIKLTFTYNCRPPEFDYLNRINEYVEHIKKAEAKEKFEKEMDELGEKAKQLHEAIVEVEKMHDELLEEKNKILNELVQKLFNNIFKVD